MVSESTDLIPKTTPLTVPIALTIAGSDSGGGAGIQADLKTFAFHSVHGTSALTCVTAQNTLGVTRVDTIAPESVVAQISAIAQDIGVTAAKTGMLLNGEIMQAVAQQLEVFAIDRLVVDPVMVSRTGARLIDEASIEVLCQQIIPKALVLTPNCYEAQILSGVKIITLDDMRRAAKKILELGARSVLVKGGGLAGDLRGVDVWCEGDRFEVLRTRMINTPHTHGTGCTLSAAIVANLARGDDVWTAIQKAKVFVTRALEHSLAIGQGQGPVGHFFALLE